MLYRLVAWEWFEWFRYKQSPSPPPPPTNKHLFSVNYGYVLDADGTSFRI
jgi:hypothetical protein